MTEPVIEPKENDAIETTSIDSDCSEKCKYCLQSPIEALSTFVKPCKCTNPVCLVCLKKQIGLKKSLVCEICTANFQITPEMGIEIPNSNVVEVNNYDEFFEDVSTITDVSSPDLGIRLIIRMSSNECKICLFITALIILITIILISNLVN